MSNNTKTGFEPVSSRSTGFQGLVSDTTQKPCTFTEHLYQKINQEIVSKLNVHLFNKIETNL